MLFQATSSNESKKKLREILFILDEVADIKATALQCSKIVFNPSFQEFNIVRDYCQLFLNNCISFDFNNNLKLFAFLLPMEYVFEDFIAGFINKELKQEISITYQKGNTYLDTESIFKIKPDFFLQKGSKSVIADAKYKIIYSDEKDPKDGISQSDLYQMLAYAVRFKINQIILFYPNTIKNNQETKTQLKIHDSLANKEIVINAYQLPIINHKLLHLDLNKNKPLNTLFESTKEDLSKKLKQIINNTI